MSPAGRAEEGDEENKQGKAAWPLIASPAIGRGPLLNKRLAHPLLTHCSMGIHRSACVTPYWEAIETGGGEREEERRGGRVGMGGCVVW